MEMISHKCKAITKMWVAVIVAVIIIAAIVGAVYYATLPQAPPQALPPIKIGYCGPLSGVGGDLGEQSLKGAMLAVEEANAEGGVLGRKVEIYPQDNKGVPSEAVSGTRKLITDYGVVAIVGQVYSSCTLAAEPLYNESKVVGMCDTSTNPRITQQAGVGGNDWFFRINLPDDINSWVYGKTIVEKGGKRICMLAPNDDWGVGCVEGFSKTFEEEGATILSVDYYLEGETDFRSVLAKIKSLDPDCIQLTARTAMGATIAKQAYELGLHYPIFVQGDVVNDEFLGMVGPEIAEGIMGCESFFPGGPESKDFEEAFKKRWGVTAWEPAGYGYVATKAIFEAIKLSGGATSEAIREGLKKLDMATFVGRVKFDEHNQAWTHVVVAKWGPGGTVVPVYTVEVERPSGYWEGTWR
jgi:branched-chain amino acid transport system substrate-binding protein